VPLAEPKSKKVQKPIIIHHPGRYFASNVAKLIIHSFSNPLRMKNSTKANTGKLPTLNRTWSVKPCFFYCSLFTVHYSLLTLITMNTTPTETAISVSTELIADTLTAMHWVISPYTDGDANMRDDYPWIYELALVYNKLVTNLNNSPEPIQHDFEQFKI
jgi:hypothetical protein